MSLVWSTPGRPRPEELRFSVQWWRRGYKPSSGGVTHHDRRWAAMLSARFAKLCGFQVEVRDRGPR